MSLVEICLGIIATLIPLENERKTLIQNNHNKNEHGHEMKITKCE
jgi:hypothetical protein